MAGLERRSDMLFTTGNHNTDSQFLRNERRYLRVRGQGIIMHRPRTDEAGHASAVWTVSCTLILLACLPASVGSQQPAYGLVDACETVDELRFDGDMANASVGWQVGLGPRIPGSNASEALRANITSDLESLGYTVHEETHQRYNMTLTNVFATWTPVNITTPGQLVLSAHYDSRNVADQDENESNRTLPVPGANDAASGVAVLLELARHIPNMTLSHEVVLFFNDAEDQDHRYTLGAEAWAENLTSEEVNNTHAFVLLDMVGDADLQLHNVLPGNGTLKDRVVELGTSLGLVNGTADCSGALGRDIVQYDTLVGVLDDHVHAHELGIPAIDIMDTSYGTPKPYTFGSHWHTMEDTPDKVSAESLESVGRLVELGLRTGAFVDLKVQNETTDDAPEDSENDATESSPVEDTFGPQQLAFGVALVAILSIAVAVARRPKSS